MTARLSPRGCEPWKHDPVPAEVHDRAHEDEGMVGRVRAIFLATNPKPQAQFDIRLQGVHLSCAGFPRSTEFCKSVNIVDSRQKHEVPET